MKMDKPNLFDVVELTIDEPGENLARGAQGTIVECYADGAYEVEFTDDDGQTIALCAVAPEHVRIVHQAATTDKKQVVQKLLTVINGLDKEQTKEVLDFADFLRQRQVVAQ